MKKLLLFSLLFLSASGFLQAQMRWDNFGNLAEGRHWFQACHIPGTERVLVIGGYAGGKDGSLSGTPTGSCEIIDLKTGTIVPAAVMASPRAEFPALYTRDSNIVVISGIAASGSLTPSVELYNRSSGVWTTLGNLTNPRRQHAAIFINDNEILIVGGRSSDQSTMNSAEIFNIATGKSRPAKNFPYAMAALVAGLSSKGEFLFFSGRDGGTNSFRTKEIFRYETQSNNWVKLDASLPEPVLDPNILKLRDGRLLVMGGGQSESPVRISDHINIENGADFSGIARLNPPIAWFGFAELQPGFVMLAGGNGNDTKERDSSAILEVSSGEFITGSMLRQKRTLPRMVSVPSGQGSVRLLMISGLSNNADTRSVEMLSFCSPFDIQGDTLLCEGSSLVLSAPEGRAMYSWSTGATTPAISITQPGVYTCITKSAEGCTAVSRSFTVRSAPVPAPVISATGCISFCKGGSVRLDAGAGYAKYRWSNGAVTQSIRVTRSGLYSVEVENANGCRGMAQALSVTVLPASEKPLISREINTLSTGGGTAYEWSLNGEPIPGAFERSYIVKEPGIYTVTVTDSNGCSAVSEPLTLTTLGVNAPEGNSGIILHPNPASGSASLSFSNEYSGNVEISVHDRLGKRLFVQSLRKDENLFSASLPVSALAPGAYIVAVKTGDRILFGNLLCE